MKDISQKVNKQRIDWQIITNKVRDLNEGSPTPLSRRYLVDELARVIKSYQNKYDILYDPINPPGGR